MEVIKLGPNDKTPDERDLIAEITMTKGRMWLAVVVSGMLFKEEVPGAYNTLEEALEATKKFVSRTRRKTLYFRQKSEARKIITKRRFSRVR